MRTAIAEHLGVFENSLLEVQEWVYVFWVRVKNKRPTFVSKKVAGPRIDLATLSLMTKINNLRVNAINQVELSGLPLINILDLIVDKDNPPLYNKSSVAGQRIKKSLAIEYSRVIARTKTYFDLENQEVKSQVRGKLLELILESLQQKTAIMQPR